MHLGTKSASRPGDQPLNNRLSTADFVPAFGLHIISLVRASGETFRRHVFDALEGMRDACLLDELFCRRPVLPDPAPPPALRLDPTRPWYVQVLDSTGHVMPCQVVARHVMSCHVLSCIVVSCHVVSRHSTSCNGMAWPESSLHGMRYNVMRCFSGILKGIKIIKRHRSTCQKPGTRCARRLVVKT